MVVFVIPALDEFGLMRSHFVRFPSLVHQISSWTMEARMAPLKPLKPGAILVSHRLGVRSSLPAG